MPSEDELRSFLRSGAEDPVPAIDAESIIRRSRRRRLPRVIVVGATTGLAVIGLGFGALSLPQSFAPSADSASTAESPEILGSEGGAADSGMTDEASLERAPADRLNLCEGPVAEVAQNELGLVLTPEFAVEALTSEPVITGTVRLTNTSAERITGSTAASPAMTLSKDGFVVWHSNGAMIAMAVIIDLGPGESIEYQASFSPVVCSVEDDLDAGFRSDLPTAQAGEYLLSAAIDFVSDDAATPSTLVTGAAQPITLR